MHTTSQGCCKIQAPRYTILAGIKRQCHQVHRTLSSGKYFLAFVTSLTPNTHPLGSHWITEIGTIGHTCYRRKQLSKSAYSRRFARPSTPTDKGTTNQ